MSSLCFDLFQHIIRVISPSAIHHDQAAFSCFNNSCQLLSRRIMIGKKSQSSFSKIRGRIRNRSRNLSKTCHLCLNSCCLCTGIALVSCILCFILNNDLIWGSNYLCVHGKGLHGSLSQHQCNCCHHTCRAALPVSVNASHFHVSLL